MLKSMVFSFIKFPGLVNLYSFCVFVIYYVTLSTATPLTSDILYINQVFRFNRVFKGWFSSGITPQKLYNFSKFGDMNGRIMAYLGYFCLSQIHAIIFSVAEFLKLLKWQWTVFPSLNPH